MLVPLKSEKIMGYFAFDLDSDSDWGLYEELAKQAAQSLRKARRVDQRMSG